MKKHLILNTALLIVGALAILVIMPFINFQEFNDTAFAMTKENCWSCHGMPNEKGQFGKQERHHKYLNPYYSEWAGDNCTMCHGPNYSYDDCVGCHTSGSVCDSTLSDHSDCKLVAHNNASLDSTDCSSCHATNVVPEHFKYISTYHLMCGLCHQFTDVVNTYNTQPDVVNTVIKGSGISGQTVYCTSCHVTTNHTAQHDHAKIDSETCTQCHNSNVVTEHANRNLSCATCHSSTDQDVIDAINKGKGLSGQDVFCGDCHGTAVDHAAAHTKIVYFLDHITSGCTVCHKTDALQEHSTYNVTCAACHNNSPYQEVIAQAVNTNAPAVTCEECHDGVSHPTDIDKTAHDTTKITYPGSDCTKCHFSSDAVTEHDKYNVDCYDCHTNNNLTKNNYLTYQQVISNAIKQVFDPDGNKVDPNPVSCTDCHGTTDHAAAHTPIPTTDTCASCHGGSLVTVHTNKGCNVCHNTTYQSIIEAGKTTPVSSCSNTLCHVGVNHEAKHTPISTTTDTCANCHGGSLVTVHADRGCSVCHNSTYQSIIDAGTTSCSNTLCHSNPASIIADHEAKHTPISTTTDTCASCHGGSLVTVHADRGCSVCHNTTYQSIIDAGKTTPVSSCSNTVCHLGFNHTTAHDNKVVIPYNDCGSCHDPNVVTEHSKYNKTCSDCHNTTYQAVMSKSTVYCADCHVSFGNHSSQHNAITVQTSCTSCHAGSYIALHENTTQNTHIYCFACHTSQSALVATAIDNGMAGTSVQCSNCHATTCSDGNQSPVANAGSDQTVQTGQSVSFSGAGSYDPDGTIASYAWNFGDGSTGTTGVTTSHTYTTAVTYTVTLTVTDNNGATGTDTAIVTVTSLANTNLALNKSTSASGSESGYGPSNAVDGNMTTRWWKKSTSEQWIRVDLGSSMSISKVILKWYSYYAKDYYIETSTDGSNWSNVKSVSGSDGGTDENTFSSKTARYVRVRCKAAYNYNGYSLYEFEVYK